MQKNLTITLDELYLNAAYQQMTQNERREADAWEWAEATVEDMAAKSSLAYADTVPSGLVL